jgi:hypothetical protein
VRSFPQAYRMIPGGGGPVSVNPDAATIPGARVRPTPMPPSPLGSALYLPPLKAMADRTMPPQEWRPSPGPG